MTADEIKLVEYSKKAIVKYNKIRHANAGIDTLYVFLLSEAGKVYDGASFKPSHNAFARGVCTGYMQTCGIKTIYGECRQG